MDLRLNGLTAIVTGASRGIGLAVTRALAAEGVLVTAGALKSSAELDELAGAGLVRAVEVDLGRIRRARPAVSRGRRPNRHPGQQRGCRPGPAGRVRRHHRPGLARHAHPRPDGGGPRDPGRAAGHARRRKGGDRQHQLPDWDLLAHKCVAIMRAEAGRDPGDRALQDLVGELCTQHHRRTRPHPHALHRRTPHAVCRETRTPRIPQRRPRTRTLPGPLAHSGPSPRQRSGPMARALANIARDAMELLGGLETQPLRQRGRDGCTRMFVDRSHGRNRPWHGMRGCGVLKTP